MSQKNTLLVISLLALATFSVNAAAPTRPVTIFDLNRRSKALEEEMKAIQDKMNDASTYLELEESAQQLATLQKELRTLNRDLAKLLK